jgi:hypothetical protein
MLCVRRSEATVEMMHWQPVCEYPAERFGSAGHELTPASMTLKDSDPGWSEAYDHSAWGHRPERTTQSKEVEDSRRSSSMVYQKSAGDYSLSS